MKKKSYFLLAMLFIVSLGYSQKIAHQLSMPNPASHYFEVETVLTNFKEKEIVLVMPVWAPGSYLVREFPKNVNTVKATDESGRKLPVRKVAKNQWLIEKGKAKEVKVKYEVYSNVLSVRTSFLDETHGYVNGTSMFTYPEGHKERGGSLTIKPHASFEKISTSLPLSVDGVASDGASVFTFTDYDELADSPIEIGNHEVFDFMAAGVKHNVAMYGAGSYDIEQLKIDMARIVEVGTDIFGQNPNKEYWFIIHNVESGDGGLEHATSTTLSTNRWVYTTNYLGFLSLVAHEYFHIWNVKRLRPSNYIEYDYNRENYTDLLWFIEGFTSYYAELILHRAGFKTEQEFLNKMRGIINYIEGMPGNKVQSVADASFDAWIKAYQPNENSRNTTVSYYSKGNIIGAMMDAMIVKASNGKKSLDDLMRVLYKKYYLDNNVGISTKIIQTELEKMTNRNLENFFEDYIFGTKTLPYKEVFEAIGIEVKESDEYFQALGISTKTENGKCMIKNIEAGSKAQESGLSVEDEIIAFNGFRVTEENLTKFLKEVEVGEQFNLIVSRKGKLISVNAIMGINATKKYDLIYQESPLSKFWLRQTVK